MIEPLSAGFFVGLLAQWVKQLSGTALEATDEAARSAFRSLWAAVSSRFTNDSGASAALARLEDDPDNSRRLAAVEDFLDEALHDDPSFAAELQRIVATLPGGAAGGSTEVHVSESGATAVGGEVRITGGGHAAGRDVVLGVEAAPSQRPRP